MMCSCFLFSCKDDETANGEKCAEGEHNWKNENNPKKRTILQNLTCTQPEVRERECKDCGHKEPYESAPPTGHQYNSANKIYMHDATCTEDGHSVTHCQFYERCGEAADRIEVVQGSALGHSFVYYVATADGYTSIAKCVRCKETSEKLLGLKLDMEGDRSHLSYQALSFYTATVTDAVKYEAKGEDNTVLTVTRPAGFEGNTLFNVTFATEVDLIGKEYVIEATFYFDEDGTEDIILFKGNKASLSQTMEFVKYDSELGSIVSLEGAVYDLTADDYANGVKVSIKINDADQLYEIYVNDKLASPRPVPFVGDYFPGIELKNIQIVMLGEGASTFSVDDFYLYPGSQPNGYDGQSANITYGVYDLATGQKISYKLPVVRDDHTVHTWDNSEVFAPDCVIGGYTVKTCSCGGQMITNEVGALGHAWDAGVNVDATCLEPGYKVTTCYECGAKKGEQIAPATGHIHGDDAVYVPAGCDTDAYTTGNCMHCGYEFTVVEKDTAHGHALGDDATVVNASCANEGYTIGNCMYCGIEYKDPSSIVPKYDHYDFAFSPYTTVPYDCENEGYEEHTCIGCGTIFHKNTIAALGHKTVSQIVTEADGSYIVNKCISCSFEEKTKIFAEGAPMPTFTETLAGVGAANVVTSFDGGKTFPGIVNRGATWSLETEGANQFLRVTNDPSYVIPSSNGNTYANFGLNDTNFTTQGKSVVFTVDVRHRSGTEHLGVNFGLMQRTDNGGSIVKSIAYSGVTKDSKVLLNGTAVYDILLDTWVRIATVYDPVAKKVSLYINGELKGTVALDSAYTGKFNYVRCDVVRTQGKSETMDVDNAIMYYADSPYYVKGAAAPTASKGCDPATVNSFLEADKNGVDFSSYVKQVVSGSTVVYKEYAKFTVADREGVKVVNYRYAPDVVSYPGNSSRDSHFTVDNLNKYGYNTIHVKITFNEVTGSCMLISPRRAGGTGGNPQYTLVSFNYKGTDNDGQYGVIKVAGKEVWTVRKGETVDLYCIDNQNALVVDAIINGKHVVDAYAYGPFAGAHADPHTGNLTYKLFNQANTGDITETKVLDLDIHTIEFYSEVVLPNNYSGKVIADKVVKGEEQTVVSFDENDSLANWFGVNSNVPDGYVYAEITGKSYLSLSKLPSDVKTKITYVQIDPDGNEVESGGTWTMKFADFKTNGSYTPLFTEFDGVKINPETGNYDFREYSSIRIRLYVKDTTAGYTFMVKANNPNVVGGSNPGICYFSTSASGGGKSQWLDITMKINPNEVSSNRGAVWSNINGIDFSVSGWSNGVNKVVVDGVSIYVQSITLIKADTTLANTGYALPGALCAEHTFGEPVNVTAENCGEIAYTYKACSECGYVDTVVEDAIQHNIVKVDAECVAPTCDKSGYDMYSCTECGMKYKVFSDKLLHDFVLKADATEAEGYIAPTCTEGGQDVYVCSHENCNMTGKTFVVPSDPAGHVHGSDVTVTEAGCGKDKTITGPCTVCGQTYVKVEEGTGYAHNIVTINTPATCTEDGSIVVKCDRDGCDHVVSEVVLPKLGHDAPADYLLTFIDRSCATYEGIRYNCRTCGEVVEEFNVEGGKDLHVWGDWTVITPASCGQDGVKEAYCTVCNGKISELGSEEEKALCEIYATNEHDWSDDYVFSSDDEYVVRTKYKVCDECGEIDYDSVVEIAAKYEGTEGFVFADNHAGKYVIVGYNGSATTVVVPATYSGKPVVLGDVFAGNTAITAVTIPTGVTVSNGAFSGCTALVSVTLPSDITAIPVDAFNGCVALKSIVLPETCTVIGTGAFYGCSALTEITILGTIEAVEQFAFAGCEALATVNYADGIRPEYLIAIGNDELNAAEWVALD